MTWLSETAKPDAGSAVEGVGRWGPANEGLDLRDEVEELDPELPRASYVFVCWGDFGERDNMGVELLGALARSFDAVLEVDVLGFDSGSHGLSSNEWLGVV